jgi:glyoxylase-like metal-dependent hydrolase (beta-lactamase superfamily II)
MEHQEVEGVWRIALRSPTLPPATHTNAYLLQVSEDRMVVVDPGSELRGEVERLASLIDAVEAERGLELEAVVLTHHHVDHVCGVHPLARALGRELEVWAHEQSAALLPDHRVTRMLGDGQMLGAWRVCFTPGHAPGHLCFVDEALGIGVLGDLIASQGTILVQPPRGDMTHYLDSLERIRAMGLELLLPAHGEPVRDADERLGFYIKHRLAREDKARRVLAALAQPAPLTALVPLVYDDAPMSVWPIATGSLLAHLLRLQQIGEASEGEGGWSLVG